MIEHLTEYTGLPVSANEIPAGDSIWVRPYIRFIADGLCDDPADLDKLQNTLWKLDSMSTGDLMDLYDKLQSQVTNLNS